MARVATYLRVSSKKQTTENQLGDVGALASRLGVLTHTFEETGSAVKKRPAFEAMLKEARKGSFDVIVVWALDRFGRSMVGNLQDLLALDAIGVRVVSVKEPWLDTSGPTRGLLVAIFSWVAEQERARLIERTHAGLERARRAGKRLGRRPLAVDVSAAREMLAAGTSQRDVAKELGVTRATLQRALARKAAA